MLSFTGETTGPATPPAARFEDRGIFFIDPITGSQVQKPISYCKDIRKCGVFDYRSVSASATLNYLENCTPRLNGVMSISGLFYQGASATYFDEMINLIILGGGPSANLREVASTVCPEV